MPFFLLNNAVEQSLLIKALVSSSCCLPTIVGQTGTRAVCVFFFREHEQEAIFFLFAMTQTGSH